MTVRKQRVTITLDPELVMDIKSVDARLGRAAGELLRKSRTADVIDAALVLPAVDGDEIVTGDVDDFEVLAEAAGRHVELIRP